MICCFVFIVISSFHKHSVFYRCSHYEHQELQLSKEMWNVCHVGGRQCKLSDFPFIPHFTICMWVARV